MIEFLRWLADDHFTLLDSRGGTSLGVLRAAQPKPRRLTEVPLEVRARVHDRQLLLITKANSRATAHRSVYLDYIGIKLFDSAGAVVGEQRRFLGLFTSAAYTPELVAYSVAEKQSACGRRAFGLCI